MKLLVIPVDEKTDKMIEDYFAGKKIKTKKLIQSPQAESEPGFALLDAETTEAIKHLHEVGLACQRCGWDKDSPLWCTASHSITPRYLLALGKLVESI